MDIQKRLREVSLETAKSLKKLATSSRVRDVSQLSLPEIEQVVNLVAQMVPAGNVPGIILSGLMHLAGRRVSAETVRRDVNLMFQGVEQVFDQAVYGAFFAGPAAVIWGYQKLLQLSGKNLADSFPEGTWQFYIEYALREDTARHATETRGFDLRLQQHGLRLTATDRLTAWVMAALHCLHQYDALLENEWRERVYTATLREVTSSEPEAGRYVALYRDWERHRPYARGPEAAPDETFPQYRHNKFDQFLEKALNGLRPELRQAWVEKVRAAKKQDLPAYQRQMSILAYLDSGAYGENRVPLSITQAHVGVIRRGHYFLLPVCAPQTEQPPEVNVVREQVAALLSDADRLAPAPPTTLAGIKRAHWPALRKKLTPALAADIDALRLAPIFINSDPRPVQLPLAEIRQAERGVGSHALTLFETGQTVVCDLSHIFFDGAWGAALAEIMTNEALAWGVYLNQLPPLPTRPRKTQPRASKGQTQPQVPEGVRSLAFKLRAADQSQLKHAPRVTPEVAAETDAVNLKAILALRKLFKRRNDLIDLTVNDLLVLYRAIHAATYQLSPELTGIVDGLAHAGATRPAALAVWETLDSAREVNPAILIPIDASQYAPRERLYPLNFEVPLKELGLLNVHAQTLAALNAYRHAVGDRSALYAEFDNLQRTYLATLAGFGRVISRAKDIALSGQSASVGTLKLLATMPAPLQRLLETIPDRFEVLNDVIRGREVFSNMGVVAPASSLTRFITAKDDNEHKTLAWGVITDAAGVMRVSLRDFRPHVGALIAAGQRALAVRLAEDYLNRYALGLNNFVLELRQITLASRETRNPGAARLPVDGGIVF